MACLTLYTGIKTNILFFTKGTPTSHIWFYEHQYPEGYKSYSKTKPMRLKSLPPSKHGGADEADGFCIGRDMSKHGK
jgi:type I restriction enzyme M protein